MKLSGAIVALLIGGALLALGGCSQDHSQADADKRHEWAERSRMLNEIGVQTTLEQDGAHVKVTVTNAGDQPFCLGAGLWPGAYMGLDHFLVENKGAVVDYTGALYSMLEGGPPSRLAPGDTLTARVNLQPYYQTDWRTAQVTGFWSPFYRCDADGNAISGSRPPTPPPSPQSP